MSTPEYITRKCDRCKRPIDYEAAKEAAKKGVDVLGVSGTAALFLNHRDLNVVAKRLGWFCTRWEDVCPECVEAQHTPDPSREVGAITLSIDAGLFARQDEVRKLGRDVLPSDGEKVDE